MKHQQVFNFLCAVSIVGLLMLTACGNQEKPESVDIVRVGVLYPISGDLASTGQDNQNGVILAAEEINADGGIQSLGGARLELVFGDTQGNPDIGAQETERLIQEEDVAAIIGAYQSSVTKPATQAAERLQTPFIVSMAISDIITERGFQYTFRVCPKAQYYGRDQVLFLKDLSKLTGYPVKRVALLYENTDYGTTTSLAQKAAIQENGLEVVAEVSYTAEGATDLSNEVAQVLAADPDAILEVTYLNDSILIVQALAEAGAAIPLVDAAGGVVYPEYVEQLGEMAEGSFTLVEYSQYAAGGQELNTRFHDRFGADITGNSAYAYQAVYVLKDALERAGSLDKEKLRAALAATDMLKGPHMILPAERIRFNADGQNEFATLFMAQIQDGELLPVWPVDSAASQVRLGQ